MKARPGVMFQGKLGDYYLNCRIQDLRIHRAIHPKPETLRKYVRRFQRELEDFPVFEVEPGVYKIR